MTLPDCSQVTLARLFPSDTDTIVPKWHWHYCSQVRLPRLFPSNTGTIVSKWHWHNCSRVTLARLFPSETSAIVTKWYWHDYSRVTLARLFPSETDTIVPTWILTFQFVFCFAVCSLALFFTSEFHLGTIASCTSIMAHDPKSYILLQSIEAKYFDKTGCKVIGIKFERSSFEFFFVY